MYAKLNLALEITGAEGGYHTLDMINCTVGAGDALAVSFAEKTTVFMDGALCGTENTAFRAAEKIREASGRALRAEIDKGIPFGAGMGGSSADAGALFRYAVDRGLMSEADAVAAAAQVGSDVIYMMRGGWKRAKGRGGELSPLPSADCAVAVVRRECGASTAEVYRRYDLSPTHGAGIDAVLCGTADRYNVLEPAAISFCPGIDDLKRRMYDAFGDAVMTGSGSAVCAMIPLNETERAERLLRDGFGDCGYARLLFPKDDSVEYI